jgi:hypothetical protein
LAHIQRREWHAGPAALDAARGTETELAASPGAPIEAPVFARIVEEIAGGLRVARFDAVYLSLHGAAVFDGQAASERAQVRSMRDVVGRHVPVAASFDLRANALPVECLDSPSADRIALTLARAPTCPKRTITTVARSGQAASLRLVGASERLAVSFRRLRQKTIQFLVRLRGKASSLPCVAQFFRWVENFPVPVVAVTHLRHGREATQNLEILTRVQIQVQVPTVREAMEIASIISERWRVQEQLVGRLGEVVSRRAVRPSAAANSDVACGLPAHVGEERRVHVGEAFDEPDVCRAGCVETFDAAPKASDRRTASPATCAGPVPPWKPCVEFLLHNYRVLDVVWLGSTVVESLLECGLGVSGDCPAEFVEWGWHG